MDDLFLVMISANYYVIDSHNILMTGDMEAYKKI